MENCHFNYNDDEGISHFHLEKFLFIQNYSPRHRRSTTMHMFFIHRNFFNYGSSSNFPLTLLQQLQVREEWKKAAEQEKRNSNFKRMHFCSCDYCWCWCCRWWWWKKKRKNFMRCYFRNGTKTYSVPYTLYTSIKWDIVEKASYFCYFVHSVSYTIASSRGWKFTKKFKYFIFKFSNFLTKHFKFFIFFIFELIYLLLLAFVVTIPPMQCTKLKC